MHMMSSYLYIMIVCTYVITTSFVQKIIANLTQLITIQRTELDTNHFIEKNLEKKFDYTLNTCSKLETKINYAYKLHVMIYIPTTLYLFH